MRRRFEDRVVLVTGAGSGIGRAAAQAFAAEGGKVVVADLNLASAEATTQAIRDAGGTASAVRADVGRFAECEAMVAHAVSTYGGLDVAFNNAGMPSAPCPEFADISIEDWDRVIATNVNGMFYAIKAEVPALKQSKHAAIVNTASTAAFNAAPNMPAYIASKHGAAGLTKAAALDLIRHGIRVNAVCPGMTLTAMMQPLVDDAQMHAALMAMIPINRMCAPEEIAANVLYLASDDASYVVGSLLRVDGGLTLA